MDTMIKEMNVMQMEEITGGVTHKNPTPSKLDAPIDGILNGPFYDMIAQMFADWANGDNVRTRKVNNETDIHDIGI